MKEHRNLAMGSMACGDTGSRILAYRMVRACLCAACAMIAPAHAAASPLLPDAQAVQATDLGVAAGGDLKTITVVLNVVNLAGLEAFVASTADPGSANYRKFLTPSQFAERYGQSDATVMQVLSYLTSMGMKPSRVHGNRLLISVQASNAQIANAFGTVMHNYQVGDVSYQAAVTAPVLPQQIAGAVSHISGLNSKPVLRPHHMLPSSTGAMAAEAKALPTMVPTPNASAATPPGSYTVRDLAQKYNITPLYQAGLTGAGRTVGIVTLAGYLQSDVESYWQALGLQFKPGRIADVMVDGGYQPGDGPGSQDSLETTIDVEQSGGVAPGANLRVYMGPNSNNGLLDTIAQAVDENLVDTLSISWGAPEVTASHESSDRR